MLLDMTIAIMERLAKELEEAETEKREHFIQNALNLLEPLIQTLIDKPKI